MEGAHGMTRCSGSSGLRPRLLLWGVWICTVLLGWSTLASAQSSSRAWPRSAEPLQIVRISPSGEDVPPGRQIVIEFNRPVVPLGRMERDASEIPVTVEPSLNCQWRWLNSAALACRLNETDALKPATRYQVTVRPGLQAADGATLGSDYTHVFITQRPRVSSTWFKTWLSPGAPQIAIRFDQPVRENSVAEHLYFTVNEKRRVAVRLTEDPDYVKSSGYRKGSVWLVTPAQELPADRPVSLRVEPGIAPLEGSEPGAEKRPLESFHTFPQFAFTGIRCETNAGKTITIPPNATAASRYKCNPTQEIALLFASPVLKEQVQGGISIAPDLVAADTDSDPWENVYSYSGLSAPHQKSDSYAIPLPEPIKPFTSYRIKAAHGAFRDEFDRPLHGALDVTFKTDHMPPDYFLFKPLGVLEKGLDSELPLAVTNLREMQVQYHSVTATGKSSPQASTLSMPGALDAPARVPLGIRGLLGTPSGVVTGVLSPTPPTPHREPSDGWFFAQVTPFAVHAKLGHYNTTVWVTDLQSGQPVAGVTVQLCRDTFDDFSANQEVLSEGTTDREGLATIGGLNKVDPRLELLWAYETGAPRLFVRCRKDADLAVLPLTYEFRVDAQGANREYIPDWIRSRFGHIRTWGTTAQGIYKVGDVVQYKVYVRDQNNRRFVLPPGVEAGTPDVYTLQVFDPMDKVVFERKDFTLSEFGACDGEFSLPGNGAVGWYRFRLGASFSEETWEPMRVLVSDFTPASFRVSTDLNGKQFAVDDLVAVTTRAALHAGGPYANAAVRLVATLEAASLHPEDPGLKGYQFDVLQPGENRTPPSQTIFQTEGRLDEHGTFATRFKVVESPVLYGRMTVESAVRDDRGKSVANRAEAAYQGRDRYVGVLQQDWVLQQGKPAGILVVVVDENGQAVAEVPVAVKVQRQQTKAARVKEAGDAYVTQYVQEWVDVQQLELKSTPEPVACEFTPDRAGTFKITARIDDTLNRPHTTSIERWAVGSGHVLWQTSPGNMMNVYPEKDFYKVGETARFLAQNPFPGSRALITVERFGVLQSWVQTFAGSAEFIEVPVVPDYLPGFYLSVLVMAPRIERVAENEHEDLGKPTFAMGYVQVPVQDPYKQIAVRVEPQKATYKPGDSVTVAIRAQPLQPVATGPDPPIELAVTVLDEAVFDLLAQGRKTFDPYQGFYSLDPLDMTNYNLIMQLVGRAKLEKKGASPGGGGGPDLSMRSFFKFVSYWNPSLALDDEGKTQIHFTAPDNLTGWRVLVLAVSPEDLMGLGDAVFTVNQSTEIRPALPNQVTAGDRFDAGFSIMNRMDATRTLEITLQAEGPVRSDAAEQSPPAAGPSPVTRSQRVTLKPYQRTTVFLPLATTSHGEITFTVQAADDTDRDGLKTTLRVDRLKSPLTAAFYGSTTGAEALEAVAFPRGMQPESGTLAVTVAPSIIGGLEGTFEFLRQYPYDCWEQKLSRGLAAAVYQKLKAYLEGRFSWEESAQIVEQTLALAVGYQAPNGGMTFYLPKDEYVSPYLSAFTALAFNRLRQDGYAPPQAVQDKLHAYLESLLRRDAVPDLYDRGMTATVRAVILAALADAGRIGRDEVERFAGHLPEMSLFGKAMYLQALMHYRATSKLQERALEAILAHADRTSGTLAFSETLDTRYKSLLTSSVRTNCAILSTFVQYQTVHRLDGQQVAARKRPGSAPPVRDKSPDGKASSPDGKQFSDAGPLGDMPLQLARTIAQSRNGRDHWLSTQDSLFALKALADFAASFESQDPAMTVRASLDSVSLGEATFSSLSDPAQVLDYAVPAADIGQKGSIRIERSGTGRLYYSTALTYTPAQLNRKPINSGIEVHREYSVQRDGAWVLLNPPDELKTGELVRVDVYLSLPAARYFVVVDDPLPGGLEPVNQQLASASTVDAAGAAMDFPAGSYRHRFDDWRGEENSVWSFYHKELRHSTARFYAEYLAPGNYHLSYAAQAIAPGQFTALPTHAEEMYQADVFGKGQPTMLRIRESR